MSYSLSGTTLVILIVVTSEEKNADELSTSSTKQEVTKEVITALTPVTKGAFAQTSTLLLLTMAGALLVTGCVVSAALWLLAWRKRRKQTMGDEETNGPPSPQKMDSEVINLSEFHDLGPLVMQARMKGRIKHALDDEKSHSLKEVAFDPKHNEIVTIGSEVEQLDGMSQLSMLSGEKSVEVIRAPRRGGFPTMASEAKKAEAAAKEAQRVAENERMIAICAARRKAKDAAAAAAAAAAAQSKSDGDASRTKSDESKSAGAKSDGTRTEVSSPEPSSVVITQRTQASTASRVEETDRSRRGPTHLKEIERRQRGPFYSPNYSSSNDSRSSKSSGNTVVKADESARRPRSVSVRRRLAHDGRTADGLGVKYEMTKSSRSSSSRTAKRSHFPEPDEEARSPRSTQSPNS